MSASIMSINAELTSPSSTIVPLSSIEYFKTVIAVKFKLLHGQQLIELGNEASLILNYEKKTGFNYEISISDIKGDIKEVSVIDNNEEVALISSRKFTISSNILSPVIMINVTYPFIRNQQTTVTYLFEIDQQRIKNIKLGEFYEDQFTLPQYDALVFSYCIRSTPYFEDGSQHPYYSLLIKNNEFDIMINEKTGNYECYIFGNEAVQLSFSFNIDAVKQQLGLTSSTTELSDAGSEYEIITNPSAISAQILKNLQEQNESFKNVSLVSSDGKQVLAHGCILAAISDVFKAEFELKPLEIDVSFPCQVIERALNFYYGQEEAIKGFENDLIQFATKYSMMDLKKTCIESLFKNITPENVCDVATLAFESDIESLKQKCLQILIKEKSKISKEKLQILPPEILVACLTMSS